MRHYQISPSTRPLSNYPMYTSHVENNPIRCCNIHTHGWIISLEKYHTQLLTWNSETESTQYLSVNELSAPHLKVVLYDYKNPIYCNFKLSWSLFNPQDIYTEAKTLKIQLDDRFSYMIYSTKIIDLPHSI